MLTLWTLAATFTLRCSPCVPHIVCYYCYYCCTYHFYCYVYTCEVLLFFRRRVFVGFMHTFFCSSIWTIFPTTHTHTNAHTQTFIWNISVRALRSFLFAFTDRLRYVFFMAVPCYLLLFLCWYCLLLVSFARRSIVMELQVFFMNAVVSVLQVHCLVTKTT